MYINSKYNDYSTMKTSISNLGTYSTHMSTSSVELNVSEGDILCISFSTIEICILFILTYYNTGALLFYGFYTSYGTGDILPVICKNSIDWTIGTVSITDNIVTLSSPSSHYHDIIHYKFNVD